MRTVIFRIKKILSKAPSYEWINRIRTLIESQSEFELQEVANQFEEMLREVAKMEDSFVLKQIILDEMLGGLVIPSVYIKGLRGRPPLPLEV